MFDDAQGVAASLASIVVAGLALGSAALASSAPIQPGYKPGSAVDEQGLWAQMEDYEVQLRRSPFLIRDPELNTYVQRVACRVAHEYCPDLRVYLVRNASFNASMAPNGMLQIWSGVLTRITSDDELATILGHELAHYEQAHTLKRFRAMNRGRAAGAMMDWIPLPVSNVSVILPLGQMAALLASGSYSRSQELAADVIGAERMRAAGFDPRATVAIWSRLQKEEPALGSNKSYLQLFLRTHPNSRARTDKLAQWLRDNASEADDIAKAGSTQAEFPRLLNAHYRDLMGDQIRSGQYATTLRMLRQHEALGVSPGLLAFFRGEALRQRARPDDLVQARSEYLVAAALPDPPPETHRNLGFLYLKSGDNAAAQASFQRYLTVYPRAPDRELIQSYLSTSK